MIGSVLVVPSDTVILFASYKMTIRYFFVFVVRRLAYLKHELALRILFTSILSCIVYRTFPLEKINLRTEKGVRNVVDVLLLQEANYKTTGRTN